MSSKMKRCFYFIIQYIIANLLFVPVIIIALSDPRNLNDADNLFLSVLGGITNLDHSSLVKSLLIETTPRIFFIYMFSKYFSGDFMINYVYVFTRQKSPGKWMSKKICGLFFHVFFALSLLFLLLNLFSGSHKLNFNISFYASIFIMNLFSIYLLSLIQNILSLYCTLFSSFIIIMIYYILSLAAGIIFYSSYFTNQILYFIFFPINSMYLWHESLPISSSLQSLTGIPNFTLFQSAFAYLFWFVLVYACAYIKIRYSDIAQLTEE